MDMYKSNYMKIKNDYNGLDAINYPLIQGLQLGGADKLKNRIKKYYEASTDLAYRTDEFVRNLMTPDKNVKEEKYKRWGITKVVSISKKKYFVKAIPVAKLFIDDKFNSSNLYNLPSYYNYGFGSAGLNPWRELLMHIKTTNFVLDNKCVNFPLLYHHRIIEFDHNDLFETGLGDKLIAKWDNENIKKYLQDRSESHYKIILFLEYIPNVLGTWIQKHPDYTKTFYDQANKIIDFLHKNNISHNDAHSYNFLVDDPGTLYLTDFGLVLDKDFDLNKDELDFLKYNKKLDYYYIIDCIFSIYFNKSYNDDKVKIMYGLDKMKDSIDVSEFLLNNIDLMKHHVSLTDYQIKFIKDHKDQILKFIIWKRGLKAEKDKSGKLKGTISAPEKNKPNSVGNVTWKFMTK